ncbi:MAG: N-acetyltransferase [Ignavibacteriae bacterium]|nr:MAG: N-acetyltransferase [Ignavibacteriota bacterium]
MLKIRPLAESEIPQLKNFPPDEWNLDLPRLISFHYGRPYFFPAAAEVDGKIVGCGIGMVHHSIIWLGTIIVLPEYRRQGIGREITGELIAHGRENGCRSFLLSASEMGESVYRKLGFQNVTPYVFYRRESTAPIRDISHVREIQPEDFPAIKELDREATGEDRPQFIERYFSTGWIYKTFPTNGVTGFYLPDFGGGLIIARDSAAGVEFMKMRFNRGKKTAVIPEANTAAREFLLSEGFQEYRRSPRMILGEEVPWQPALMYNRATGYCG